MKRSWKLLLYNKTVLFYLKKNLLNAMTPGLRLKQLLLSLMTGTFCSMPNLQTHVIHAVPYEKVVFICFRTKVNS